MALQGTFDTLSVAELLEVLGHGGKSGVLHLAAGPATGRVHLAEGRCHAVESSGPTEPAATTEALAARLVDVCFEVARRPGGTFRFEAGAGTPESDGPVVPLDDTTRELAGLLADWRDVCEVIPSLEARPRLSPELGADAITLDAAAWRLLVACDGGRTVEELVAASGSRLLDVCHAVRDLVERGAIEVAPVPRDVVVADPTAGSGATAAEAELHEVPVSGGAAGSDPADAPGDDRDVDPLLDPDLDHDAVADLLAELAPAALEPTVPYGPGVDDTATEPGALEPGALDEDSEPVTTGLLPVGEAADQGSGPGSDVDPALDGDPDDELDDDVRDRGALLRLFSALRDT